MHIDSADWVSEFGLDQRKPPEFFRTLDQVNRLAVPMYAGVMRRAWELLKLSGILCDGGKPFVFFKEVDVIEPEAMREAQYLFWNQGIARLLVVTSKNDVCVFSGFAAPTAEAEEYDKENRLLEIFSRTADALEAALLVPRIEIGDFFRQYQNELDPEQRVDRHLLNNLDETRRRLEASSGGSLDKKTIYALLGRVVFTCYLVDREIIVPSYFEKIGAGSAKRLLDVLARDNYNAKRLLYKLFSKLQTDFNGDLFVGDLDAESLTIKNDHLQILRDFLQGTQMSSGQTVLPFFPYDFSIIPIETISAIYESFLEADNTSVTNLLEENGSALTVQTNPSTSPKRKSGAYYTPPFLADLVLSTATEQWTTLLKKRCLDPSCGSGVFLVGLFNSMAEEWIRKNPKASPQLRFDDLVKILQQRIYGVDANETACRIAAFSLYIALLDKIDPRDIQELQKRGDMLPCLVLGESEQPAANITYSIFCRDFFDENLPLPDCEFDLIIGNPPWARNVESRMETWLDANQVTVPQKQLAYGFVLKAGRQISSEGRVCFLLPVKLLLPAQNNGLRFQEEWLKNYHVDRIINLADLCFNLFDNAIRPAIIARYSQSVQKHASQTIDYYVPKSDYESLRVKILTIAPDDQITLRRKEVLNNLRCKDCSLLWKQTLWGTPRDLKLLDRLSSLPSLATITSKASEKSKTKQKRWVIGQGFQPLGPNDADRKATEYTFPSDTLLVNARKFADLALVPQDCELFANRHQHFRWLTQRREIFAPPHVLVTKGLKATYADFNVIFQHAVQGINGPITDAKYLMFLTAVLSTDLARYYLFHTASDWGTERDEVLEDELLRLPFPLPEQMNDITQASAIVDEVAAKIEEAGVARLRFRSVPSTEATQGQLVLFDPNNTESEQEYQQDREIRRQQVQELVYRYYDIDDYEQMLIADTVHIWIPSSTPSRNTKFIPTLQECSQEERTNYLTLLTTILNGWAKNGPFRIDGRSIIVTEAGTGIVVLTRNKRTSPVIIPQEETASTALTNALRRMQTASSVRTGSITRQKNIKVFVDEELYILKPLIRRYWTQTSALNDADELAATLLSPKGAK